MGPDVLLSKAQAYLEEVVQVRPSLEGQEGPQQRAKGFLAPLARQSPLPFCPRSAPRVNTRCTRCAHVHAPRPVCRAQVCHDSASEARKDADALSARHTQLRRRCRLLYCGYRDLRQRLQDEWPVSAGVCQ